MSRNLNRHFSKDNIEMANRHMKRCSTSLITKEIEIKTIILLFKPLRMAVIKKFTNSKC